MTDASGAQGQGTAGADGAQGAAAAGTEGQEQQRTDAAQQQGQAAGQAQQQGQQQTADQQAAAGDAAALAQRFPGFATFPPEAQQALLARDAEARRYQREAGDERINAKTKAAQDGARTALAEAAKLAGLEIPGLTDTDKGDADPKVLAAQISTTAGERDAALKEAATVKAAMLAGVDPTKLDYLQFQLSRDAQYQGLALDSADFSAKLSASIASYIAKDSTLKLTGSAAASGVESLGGSGSADEITPEKFQRMSIQERQDLYLTDKPTYDRLVAAN